MKKNIFLFPIFLSVILKVNSLGLRPIRQNQVEMEVDKLPMPKDPYKKQNLTMFICTHKDFIPKVTRPEFKIVADGPESLKYKYPFEVIFTDKNNEIYQRKVAYAEGSKMYYIWKNYEIKTKYVGFNHYSRYFKFMDDIPDLDEIFTTYDAIIRRRDYRGYSIKYYFQILIYLPALDECLQIVKEKYPSYYERAEEEMNGKKYYWQSIFIMKKEDFKEYGKFVFSILFEFDKRHNFTTQEDVENWAKNEWPKELGHEARNYDRLDAFILEHLSHIFYVNYFKNFLEIDITNLDKTTLVVNSQDDIPVIDFSMFTDADDKNTLDIKSNLLKIKDLLLIFILPGIILVLLIIVIILFVKVRKMSKIIKGNPEYISKKSYVDLKDESIAPSEIKDNKLEIKESNQPDKKENNSSNANEKDKPEKEHSDEKENNSNDNKENDPSDLKEN